MANFETLYGTKLVVHPTSTITVAEIDALIKEHREVVRTAEEIVVLKDKKDNHYFAVNDTFTGLPHNTDIVILLST